MSECSYCNHMNIEASIAYHESGSSYELDSDQEYWEERWLEKNHNPEECTCYLLMV